MWQDVKGQESFPVSAGFELTSQGLFVQEHNYSATTHSTNPYQVKATLNNVHVEMEICSGAAVSIIGDMTYKAIQHQAHSQDF